MKSIAEKQQASRDNLIKLFDHLLKPDTAVVLDVDGTMAAYHFGEYLHTACPDSLWEDYVESNKPYEGLIPMPQVKRFIQAKAANGGGYSLYVCSVSQLFETVDKRKFVLREFPEIPEPNIQFVRDKQQKVSLLERIKSTGGYKENQIAIVDDTVKTLDMVYGNGEYITVHNSTIYLYDLYEELKHG